MRIEICLLVICLCGLNNVYGACSSSGETGVAGQVKFFNGTLQLCDGTSWQGMKGNNSSSCTGAVTGKVEYVSNTDFVWFDGSSCWSAKNNALGACATNGQWTWDAGNSVMKACINGTWYALTPLSSVLDDFNSGTSNGWTYGGNPESMYPGSVSATGFSPQEGPYCLGLTPDSDDDVNYSTPFSKIYNRTGVNKTLSFYVRHDVAHAGNTPGVEVFVDGSSVYNGIVSAMSTAWTAFSLTISPVATVSIRITHPYQSGYFDTTYVDNIRFE